jgi:3-methyladenine DNA glycosylase AlkD
MDTKKLQMELSLNTSLDRDLHEIADSEIAKHSSRFFKTDFGEYGYEDKFLGIRVPTLRKLAKQYRDLELDEVITLLKSEYHEKRMVALFILVLKYPKDKERVFQTYLHYKDCINNWDLIDTTCPHIMGDYLLERDKTILYELAKSENLWDRRKAILATFALIHKAVGWMLREVGKRDLELEKSFLRENYGDIARTTLRYAIERFEESERVKYLKFLV